MPQRQAFCCQAAEGFAGWIERLLTLVLPEGKAPTEAAINHLLAHLAKQFWVVRGTVAVDHRDRQADERGRLCVYGVFLVALERATETMMAVIPEPPAKPPRRRQPEAGSRPQIFGLPIGEQEDGR